MANRQRLNLAAYWFLLSVAAFGSGSCEKSPSSSAPPKVALWTCAMHPSVRSTQPGKCPICGMDLIPVNNRQAGTAVGESGPAEFSVPVERQQQIGVSYSEARIRPIRFNLRSLGTIEADKARLLDCVSHVDGYIEKMMINSPGEHVAAMQPLLTIYSADLRAPEQEFVNLLKVRANGSVAPASMDHLLDLARRRLIYLNFSDTEISELERTQEPDDRVLIRSPFDAVVSDAPIKVGMAVKPGDKLMTLLDLSNLWLWSSFYENDVGLLKVGQPAKVSMSALPGRFFTGQIAAISPTIDAANGTAKIRIDLPNPNGLLRPGMHADVTVEVDEGEGLTIPFDSVLPTGSRMLVFVNKGAGKLEPRFIEVGREFSDPADPDAKRFYQVTSGLRQGERVVSAANFLIDAEARIQGVVRDFGDEKAFGK
jgi:Cu(I)/Ag(I) efflux system membrane fusion protein